MIITTLDMLMNNLTRVLTLFMAVKWQWYLPKDEDGVSKGREREGVCRFEQESGGHRERSKGDTTDRQTRNSEKQRIDVERKQRKGREKMRRGEKTERER